MLGFFLEPFHSSIRKQLSGSPKFYLFDLGVQRSLSRTLDIPLRSGTYMYGQAFEHFVINEIHRLNEYNSRDFQLSYLRTKSGLEIDIILDRPGLPLALVEIKSKQRIDRRDLKSLISLGRDIPNSESFCLSRDPKMMRIDNVRCLPWKEGIKELFSIP